MKNTIDEFKREYPRVPQADIDWVLKVVAFFNAFNDESPAEADRWSAMHVLFSALLDKKGLAAAEADVILVWGMRELDGLEHAKRMLLQSLRNKGVVTPVEDGQWN